MIVTIFLGIIALYVVVEVGTAVYIVLNRRTAIPRIRTNLRYLFGLDQDSTNFRQAVGDVSRQVEEVDYRNEVRRQELAARGEAIFKNLTRKVSETNKVVSLTARRKNGKR